MHLLQPIGCHLDVLLKRNMIKSVTNKNSSFIYINPGPPYWVLSTKSGYFVFQCSFLRDKDEKCFGVILQFFLSFGFYFVYIYTSPKYDHHLRNNFCCGSRQEPIRSTGSTEYQTLNMFCRKTFSQKGSTSSWFFYAHVSLISSTVNACIIQVFYDVCFVEPLLLFVCSMYILRRIFP